ncbi:acyltransferase domain-containing protein, partial [Actinosynnema sp. NPDC023658]|uniref:acyltransferase domain-containing protein n=1 Tax=Actinosynnema sp. NPDC023658 TaxID=3155465 RepID=UPI003403730F
GVAFADRPLGGDVALVFTGGAPVYRGMGRGLALALPGLVAGVTEWFGEAIDDVRATFLPDAAEQSVLSRVLGASWLSQLHARLSLDVLGLNPRVTIGYSSGENNALLALGAWPDAKSLLRDTRDSPLFRDELVDGFAAVRRWWQRNGITGTRWRAYLLGGDVERVRAAIDGERAVHLMSVNSPDSCTVGGEEGACERFLERLRPDYAVPLTYDVAAHAPVLEEVADAWRALHHRPTKPVPGVRFYTTGTADWFHADTDAAAEALTRQALGTMHFAATVQRAWHDGVRVFVEHGPRALCTGWIDTTLRGREHLALALDPGAGDDVEHVTDVVAQLVAAGVDVDHEHWTRLIGAAHRPPASPGRTITVPAHPPLISFPEPAVDAPVAAAPGRQSALDPRIVATLTGAPCTIARGPTAAAVVGGIHATTTRTHLAVLTGLDQLHQRYLAVSARAIQAASVSMPADRTLFDRATLEHLAHGKVSAVFGPLFAELDDRPRQTRMPRPPMLLADRVLDLDGEPASMGRGVIRTETDVRHDSWYLDPSGRMPAGLMLEAGQADLLLISWLGADLHHDGDRVYRLLGCELTFHDSPPVPGDTLRFRISVDGHADHDGTHLFFFHYDCHTGDRLRLTVRHGQAGFFTDEQLAATGGLLWDPTALRPAGPHTPATGLACGFDDDQVRSFSRGDLTACFGRGWEITDAHVRTPRIADGHMLLFDRVTDFDPAGGTLGRGYLRAELDISPDHWFFDGHFHHDPCMPGSLMFDGCLQAAAFHLTALGHTRDRDGWRFEPVPQSEVTLRCRGQVTPQSRSLVYEVFVTAHTDGPLPEIAADLVCTVDGVRAFHAAGVRLRLVPDWPHHPVPASGRPVARSEDGVPFDETAMSAFATGRPSAALGRAFEVFDGPRRMMRLPAPPLQFLDRITEVIGSPRAATVGDRAVGEHDVRGPMPLSAVMETALQTCGWLAAYTGTPLRRTDDLRFRNLDGTLTPLREIPPGTTTLRTEVELTAVSDDGTLVLESFTARTSADGVPVLELETTFGFFPNSAFDEQAGRSEEGITGTPNLDLDLRDSGLRPLMLDRVTGFWPDGGSAGLGRLRAEKVVRARDWYFTAHFFTDPVQPGSLGVEAMAQLLRHHLVRQGWALHDTPQAIGHPMRWSYRGQVVPTHDLVTVEVDLTAVASDHVVADGRLWVDGLLIYRVEGLSLSGRAPEGN